MIIPGPILSFTLKTTRIFQPEVKDPALQMAHAAGNPDTHEIPEIMKQYRSGGTPWTVIIDPEGGVVYNHFHIEPHQVVAFIKGLLKK